MTTINVSDARDTFAELVNRVAYGKERVVVQRRGKALVAVVPVEDLEDLEAFEDAADVRAAKEALAEQGDKPGKPLADLKSKYGLD